MITSILRQSNKQTKNILTIAIVIALGVFLRLLAAYRGHNFDFNSYLIVVDIFGSGGNVYQETNRYNYGPIWFHLLYMIDMFRIESIAFTNNFRLKISLFLTLIDFGIFIFLLRQYSMKIGVLFFLNPISIIITGYHSQFDNIAILLGLISIFLFATSSSLKASSPKKTISLILLGLSLTTKHILFIFPLWLAMKEKRFIDAIIVIFIPYAIFIAGFFPYLPDGADGIVRNVFLYKSFDNAPFWAMFSPNVIYNFIPRSVLMVLALIIFGFVTRRRPVLESLHFYLISLVVFSSAIANQYLAIPLASIAVYWNPGFALYSIVGTLFLFTDGSGLHLHLLQAILFHFTGHVDPTRIGTYNILVFILIIGFFSIFKGPIKLHYIRTLLKSCWAKLLKGI